jgi:hypothetical protein
MFERMKRRGIPGWLYFLIPLPAAVPLMAVNAGISHMTLPLFGRIELGLLYPLALIPLALLCCSNATNFLAGFNGLETGMGLVLHLSLGFYAALKGKHEAALIALTFAAALAAFLRFNWQPAKVFPGDLNYTIGAAAVCVTVVGNMERFAILCFTPWIFEAFLKARSKFQAESYGVLQEARAVQRVAGQPCTHRPGGLNLYRLIRSVDIITCGICHTVFSTSREWLLFGVTRWKIFKVREFGWIWATCG